MPSATLLLSLDSACSETSAVRTTRLPALLGPWRTSWWARSRGLPGEAAACCESCFHPAFALPPCTESALTARPPADPGAPGNAELHSSTPATSWAFSFSFLWGYFFVPGVSSAPEVALPKRCRWAPGGSGSSSRAAAPAPRARCCAGAVRPPGAEPARPEIWFWSVSLQTKRYLPCIKHVGGKMYLC